MASSIGPRVLIAGLAVTVGVLVSGGSAQAQARLSKPVAPEGSARTIGMGSAVVALGGDSGAIPVNPASVSDVGPFGGDSLTASGGALGSNFFLSHTMGQSEGDIPASVWATALSGPLANEQAIAYTAGSGTGTGVSVGTTLRYERWTRGDDTSYHFNGDIGVREAASNGLAFGLSALNLLHPTVIGGANSLVEDTQVIGGVGFSGSHARGEVDYVYTLHHSYARFGGEVNVTPVVALRAGASDRDITIGASAGHGGNQFSVALDFLEHQHTLIVGGISSKF